MCAGHWIGGRNRERKRRIPHISPVPCFVLRKAKIAKAGEVYLWYAMVIAQKPCGRQLNANVCGSKSAIFVFVQIDLFNNYISKMV